MTKFKWITVDAYSALLDLEGSMVPIVRQLIPEPSVDPLAFFRMWRTRQWDYVLLSSNLGKGYHSYRYLTEATLTYTLAKFKIELAPELRAQLAAAWAQLKAWPEAKNVFAEIKNRGYKIAILSNGDEDMLHPLKESTGIPFDEIFCAEQAKAYKPNPLIYRLPFERLQLHIDDVLHVAGSPFDMMGAKSAGLHCAWSNRYNEVPIDLKYQPDYQWSNLSGLLEIL